MKLRQRDTPPAAISVVSMIDVLMIMLIFFMVTSTFLDLDMIPLVDGGETAAAPTTAAPAGPGAALLVRLGADDQPRLRGAPLAGPALTAEVQARRRADPGLSVVLLPSGQASTQALVSTMEAVTAAGVTELRILRLEAAP